MPVWRRPAPRRLSPQAAWLSAGVPHGIRDAREWVVGGGLRLPQSIACQPYSAEYYASALIYEFVRRNEREEGQIRTPSDVPGRVHLEKGGLWQALAPH
jgi:hypothetical protein